jgi:AcrR family transcriptional regulator
MTERLPAAERRAAVLGCACRAFARGSYRGTTTADIARSAGVTEPILYRHFDSKRDLYLACLEDTWRSLRALWDEALEAEPDPGYHVRALGQAFFRAERDRPVISNLWIQALSEASEDAEIRRFMRRHLRDVHAYVADVIARSQASGGIRPDRDPRAEAWLFLAVGLLKMTSVRLGGLLEDDFPEIVESRFRWLTGRDGDAGPRERSAT